MIEQPHSLRVDERKQVQIDLVLGLLAWLDVDTSLLELLRRPIAAVPVSNGFRSDSES
jgi:hypothetical protein